jgi:hypothetical protein
LTAAVGHLAKRGAEAQVQSDAKGDEVRAQSNGTRRLSIAGSPGPRLLQGDES